MLPFGINVGMRSNSKFKAKSKVPLSVARALPTTQPALVYSLPAKVAALTRAVINSFLEVNEGWINSINSVTTHQRPCVLNGQWNAGTCALVIKQMDWRHFSGVDHEPHHRGSGASGFDNTFHNKDMAHC